MKARRAKPFAATLASEKRLTAEGWTCTRVERSVPPGIKFDAFGFGDLLCASPTRGIMLVQVTGGTSTSNFHARVAKIKAEDRAGIWLASGGRIQIHHWQRSTVSAKRECWVLEIRTKESAQAVRAPAKIVDILTTTPTSRLKARKSHGAVRKPRAAKALPVVP